MHRVGLVHRGICPENIRVLDNGRARLAGYATVGLRTAGSGLHEQLYEGYSAPEQYSTAEFEGRYTDEYSLAAVFYRMVCGQSPVPAAQRAVSDSNPRAKTLEPSVPVYISEALQLGLRLKPAERIQTVPLLLEALSSPEKTDALARSLRTAPAEGAAGPSESTGRRVSMQTILTGILLLLAVLTALTLWSMLGRLSALETPPPAPSEPASSSEITQPQNLVPSLVGISYSQVQNHREYTGIYLFYVTEEYSDDVPAGTILRQQPDAGLESRGLVPSCFMVFNDGSYASGCVVSASVEAGTMAEVGSTVVVYIAADRDVAVSAAPEDPAASSAPADSTPPEEGETPQPPA